MFAWRVRESNIFFNDRYFWSKMVNMSLQHWLFFFLKLVNKENTHLLLIAQCGANWISEQNLCQTIDYKKISIRSWDDVLIST